VWELAEENEGFRSEEPKAARKYAEGIKGRAMGRLSPSPAY